MKRIKLILIGFVVLLATVGILATILFLPARSDNSMRLGLASKMLALLDGDMGAIKATSDYFNSKNPQWYEKYMNYMYANGLLDVSENKPSKNVGQKVFTYGDLKFYLKVKDIEPEKIKEVTGIDIAELPDNEEIAKGDFMEMYESGYTDTEIAQELGAHASSVWQYRKRRGLESNGKRGKSCKTK